jgi:hypothetical protein
MSLNDMLYEEVLKSIDTLYSDKSVSIEKAMENLQGIRDHVEILLEALRADLREGG